MNQPRKTPVETKKQRLLNLLFEMMAFHHVSSVYNCDMQHLLSKNGNDRNRAAALNLCHKNVKRIFEGKPMMNALTSLAGEKGLSKMEMRAIDRLIRSIEIERHRPLKLLMETENIISKSIPAWRKAKENNDFKSFLPHLEQLVTIKRQTADKLMGPLDKETPYEVVRNDFDEDITLTQLTSLLNPLGKALGKLLRQLQASPYKPGTPMLKSRFPKDKQLDFAQEVAKRLGFDLDRGTFAIGKYSAVSIALSRNDVRIFSPGKEDSFIGAYAPWIHEIGHGIYTQNMSEFANTWFVGWGLSMGIHESQSRFYENVIGKHPGFLAVIKPLLDSLYPDTDIPQMVPGQLHEILLTGSKKIRTQSDEISYMLHIILRFKIESALINGTLEPKDVPERWNDLMAKYFNIRPITNTEGCLQDIHWAKGNFGYFPSYALGNLLMAQLSEAMDTHFKATLSKGIDTLISEGGYRPILNWLRQNVHQNGPAYSILEMAEHATGKPLSHKPFVSYVSTRYTKLYQI